MARHHVERVLPYTPMQLYTLVGDVRRYPEFVPWITSMRVWNEHVEAPGLSVCDAEATVGFSFLREKFATRVRRDSTGEVEKVGSLVSDVKVGDRVTAEGHIVCGHCHLCRTGNAHVCPNTKIIGVDRDGAFADYIAMPATNVWQLDANIPFEIGGQVLSGQERFQGIGQQQALGKPGRRIEVHDAALEPEIDEIAVVRVNHRLAGWQSPDFQGK